jgi:hypothetical protein
VSENVPLEYGPLIKAADEAGDTSWQANVTKATVNVQGVKIVLKGWAHKILSIELRARSDQKCLK